MATRFRGNVRPPRRIFTQVVLTSLSILLPSARHTVREPVEKVFPCFFKIWYSVSPAIECVAAVSAQAVPMTPLIVTPRVANCFDGQDAD
ncbi:hypothetical protein NPIL_685671 [Nephila pilipes]|uniref:Uncharacterized protein n=1 Tax=Nephila pilipes TaxID=299642 RepID=A0A8X6PF10_NEPPI|nr:hypothetical protein NPIL_685671 [Nephila pilipes]